MSTSLPLLQVETRRACDLASSTATKASKTRTDCAFPPPHLRLPPCAARRPELPASLESRTHAAGPAAQPPRPAIHTTTKASNAHSVPPWPPRAAERLRLRLAPSHYQPDTQAALPWPLRADEGLDVSSLPFLSPPASDTSSVALTAKADEDLDVSLPSPRTPPAWDTSIAALTAESRRSPRRRLAFPPR